MRVCKRFHNLLILNIQGREKEVNNIKQPHLETAHYGWHHAADMECLTTGVCKLDVLDLWLWNGDDIWFVQAYSPAGMGAWSSENDPNARFTVQLPE